MIQLAMREWVVLSFITRFIDTKGYAPSMSEIMRGCGLHSTCGVRMRLDDLEALGLISRQRHKSRAIVLHRQPVMVQPVATPKRITP
jgi:repressor LexA